jgi:hypothetical protein
MSARRDILRLAPAALAGVMMARPSQTAPVSPDAELIEVCNALMALRREQAAICRADPMAPDRGPLHDRYQQTWVERARLEERLYESSDPKTMEGARPLARLTLAHAERDRDGDIMSSNLSEHASLWVSDLLAGEGRIASA